MQFFSSIRLTLVRTVTVHVRCASLLLSTAPLSQGVATAGCAPCLIWQSFYAVCPSWRNPEEICVSSWKQTRDLSLAQLI